MNIHLIMKKKILEARYTQQEMFELITSMSDLFGFTVTRAVSPHGWCKSPHNDRTIDIKSGSIVITTDKKLYAFHKKRIAEILHGKFESEKKNPESLRPYTYEFSF